jgi:hypothetical protein
MYNMNISLFGYKMNVMTLLFVAIVIILVSHTYCGCNNPYALIEGMEQNGMEQNGMEHNGMEQKDKKKEGFTGANTNYGQSSPYDIAFNTPIDTSSWSAPSMVVTPGQPLNPAVKAFLARPEQPIPLPEGQMDLFFNTPFKPECCPNTYSRSDGCACMTGKQFNWLKLRAGNNVPYSEY